MKIRARNFIDRTGHKYGMWKVLGLDDDAPKGKTRWICECECGTIRSISATSLQQGSSKGCGCTRNTTAIDITGEKYGLLKVIKRAPSDGGRNTKWECLCDCGNTCVVKTAQLRSGKTRSCGCLKKKNTNAIDLTGMRFYSLVVIERAENAKNGEAQWKCLCDCGNTTIVRGYLLRSGITRSCCCYRLEKTTSHGMSSTHLYKVWVAMKHRCKNQNDHNYNRYGGRGISVCKKWDESFEAFYEWSILSGYKEGLSIDRIDNDGNYEPSNCRWVTQSAQANNRSASIFIEYLGERKTISEWCKILGLNSRTVYGRYKNGWDIEDLFSPPCKKRPHKYGSLKKCC